MSKFNFILFLFFCSLNSFSQKCFLNKTLIKSDTSAVIIEAEKEKTEEYKKEKIQVHNYKEIHLFLNNNLCEILSIKPSDLLNEEMLKKFKAIV